MSQCPKCNAARTHDMDDMGSLCNSCFYSPLYGTMPEDREIKHLDLKSKVPAVEAPKPKQVDGGLLTFTSS